MGTELQLGKMKMFWGWLVVMVAEKCDYAYCHTIVPLNIVKMVNLYVMCISPQ